MPAAPVTAVDRSGRHGAVPAPESDRSRGIAMGLLGGIALSLMIYQYQFRNLEADAAAHLFGVITPTLAGASAPIIWFGLPGAKAFGLVITPDCSSALLIVPLCVLGMLLMIPRKLRVRRVAKAVAVAATLLVSGNMLRIAVIAVTTRLGGLGAGYQFGHLVLGSLISIVCIALSLTLLTAMVSSKDGVRVSAVRRRNRRAAS
ncbi:MAG: exosortase/archaeosortase family protein [Actinomycetota bacterium]|nr:exosortase/archaeosortase family protein [Actinomycetota bacterium]